MGPHARTTDGKKALLQGILDIKSGFKPIK
jgi:hypothetical protein